IFYIITVALLINYLDDKTMSTLYRIIIIVSIILSVDIIIKGVNLLLSGVNLRNLRHYTLLDKPGYNMLYTFALPIVLVNNYYNKNIKNRLTLLLFIIASLFMMQIKSLLYTIPLGLVITLSIFNFINVKSLFKYIFLMLITGILVFSVYPQFIPKQISVPINYYVFKNLEGIETSDLRNLDTVIVRGEIWKNSMGAIKENPMIGIGYGNYHKVSENKTIISDVTGILYNMPTVTESGLLTFIIEGGIIGALLHFILIILISIRTKNIKVKTVKTKEVITTSIIFFAFIVSNIVQDNLNYLYWFIIAAQIYNIRQARLEEIRSN
ncbi:O-antigen ligase family protein, partial [[Clostridium] dakarense]|uniref:O-antigen ligase family protein n=1 Tax=Faecalimicrobium dakarense TaxID=1301100 RepID=UPI0005AACC0C